MERSAIQPQREWIAIGMAECCASRGFEETSVVDVCAAAGVTREVFDQTFAERSECLGAAVELLVEKAWRRLERVPGPDAPWGTRLHEGVTALLGLLAEHPALAHVALFEAPTAPGRAHALHDSCRAALLEFLDQGRARASEPEIPPSAASGALAGAETLVRGRLLNNEAASLPALAPDIVYMLAVPFVGVRPAQQLAAEPRRRRLRAVA